MCGGEGIAVKVWGHREGGRNEGRKEGRKEGKRETRMGKYDARKTTRKKKD